MSTEETKGGPGPEYNPFASENLATGGGLWDGKKVTITRIACETRALTFKDGKPVMDEKTGKQSLQTALYLTGIAEGEEKEREEAYTPGERMEPTADKEGFVMKDGSTIKFHANSNLGKLAVALGASGFDTKILFPGGRLKFTNLVGAQLTFKGEVKLGRDGKPLKDKKGYEKNAFFPVKFHGFVSGTGTSVAGVVGGTAPGALDEKATAAVVGILAGGPKTRAELVKALATTLVGDADSNAIIGLVVRDDFHKGKPWKYEVGTASL